MPLRIGFWKRESKGGKTFFSGSISLEQAEAILGEAKQSDYHSASFFVNKTPAAKLAENPRRPVGSLTFANIDFDDERPRRKATPQQPEAPGDDIPF